MDKRTQVQRYDAPPKRRYVPSEGPKPLFAPCFSCGVTLQGKVVVTVTHHENGTRLYDESCFERARR